MKQQIRHYNTKEERDKAVIRVRNTLGKEPVEFLEHEENGKTCFVCLWND